MPSPTFRGVLAGVAAVGLAAATADSAAAKPTRWAVQFTDNSPRDLADTTKDWVSFYRHDGDRPPVDGKLSVRVIRGGATIATSDYTGYWGGETALPDLRAGDLAQLIDTTTGGVVSAATYDGNPTIDDATCIGGTTFSGTRTGNAPVDEVGAYRWIKRKGWDGSYTSPSAYWARGSHRNGQVTTLTGTTFGGTFETALAAGDVVWMTSHYLVGTTQIVSSYVEKPVGPCPPPAPPEQKPAPVVPQKDTTAPKALFSASPKPGTLKKITLKKLGSSGLKFSVTSNEGGTISATLLLRTSKKKAPVVVGSATATAKPGAATEIKLVLAKGAKSKLKKAPASAKLIARVTVTDAAGNAAVLPDVIFKVPSA